MKKFFTLIIACVFMSFYCFATETNDDKYKLKKTEFPKTASDYKYYNSNSNYNNNYNSNSNNSNSNSNNSNSNSKKSYLTPEKFPETYSSSPICPHCNGSRCVKCDFTGYNTNKIK